MPFYFISFHPEKCSPSGIEGNLAMTANLSDRTFLIHPHPVNLRKSFDGLLSLLETAGYSVAFFDGRAFVFVNRRRNMFKCIYWENGTLAIWNKRLTQGTFAGKAEFSGVVTFSDLLFFVHGFNLPKKSLI